MGVGNFFGTMPEEIRRNSHLHGVELDSISGRIARQLYQSADIQITGFEKTEFSDNFFDAAVGNVPFGSYGVSDKRYNRENFFIHDYFLAKTLDKLAPGGVAALITTKGTLDKENPRVREYLARRGDLIGAIRLPNNALRLTLARRLQLIFCSSKSARKWRWKCPTGAMSARTTREYQ